MQFNLNVKIKNILLSKINLYDQAKSDIINSLIRELKITMKYDEEIAVRICELLNDNIPRTRLEIEAELGVKNIDNELYHLVFCDDLQKYVRRDSGKFQYAPNHYQN